MERLCECGHPRGIHLVGFARLSACVYDHGSCPCRRYCEVTQEQPVNALKNKFVLATSRLESEKRKTFYAKESLAAAQRYVEILERDLKQCRDEHVDKSIYDALTDCFNQSQASVKELRVALKAMIDSAASLGCGLKCADDAYANTEVNQ